MIDLALLVLRLGLGIMFFLHGLQAFGMFAGPGIKGFAGFLTELGFSPALFWAYIGVYTELVGGLLLMFGILTRASALFLLIFIALAGFKVHLSKGFFIQSGGFEYTFIIACICVALIIAGAGKFRLFNKF
jgi:putative oxidoreductase